MRRWIRWAPVSWVARRPTVLGETSPELRWPTRGLVPRWSTHLAGQDVNPGQSEIYIIVKTDLENWYDVTGGPTPGSMVDILSAILHEIADGMNGNAGNGSSKVKLGTGPSDSRSYPNTAFQYLVELHNRGIL